ncbi:MAG: DUF7342 family protein [archaeon]
MEPMERVTGQGEQDGPPPGTAEWKDQTKTVERIIGVVLTLDRPQTAGWISDQAAVAEQTARDYLGSLTDLGVVAKTEARGVSKYQLDRAYKRFKEVSEYVEKFERDELMDLVADIQGQIEETKDTYGVDTPDELRRQATADGTSPEDVREYKKAASEWETLEHRLDVIEEALERYDEFRRQEAVA